MRTFRCIHTCLCSLGVLLLTVGCAASTKAENQPTPSLSQQPAVQGGYQAQPIAAAWLPLLERLQADGLDGEDLTRFFAVMGAPTPDPMGRKIRELYTNAFTPKPKPKPGMASQKPRPQLYKGVVTPKNVQLCRDFLATHQEVFARIADQSGVPANVAVALIFVETRLGAFLGRHNALYSLASMAASRKPETIEPYLSKLPASETRLDWIEDKMIRRSDWAYKELVALLHYLRAAQTDPNDLEGSIYGAIGYCQFMPTNIPHYGKDGDNDGIVNLFTVPDAVASLSNYLVKHGWNKAETHQAQHKVIRRYNHSNMYASTILALAKAIDDAERNPAPETTPTISAQQAQR